MNSVRGVVWSDPFEPVKFCRKQRDRFVLLNFKSASCEYVKVEEIKQF